MILNKKHPEANAFKVKYRILVNKQNALLKFRTHEKIIIKLSPSKIK